MTGLEEPIKVNMKAVHRGAKQSCTASGEMVTSFLHPRACKG